MIAVNSVYKYMDTENGERIRIIDIIKNDVYIVNLDSATAMPKIDKLEKIQEELGLQKLISIRNPFLKIIDDKEITKIQIEKRNQDWKLIYRY